MTVSVRSCSNPDVTSPAKHLWKTFDNRRTAPLSFESTGTTSTTVDLKWTPLLTADPTTTDGKFLIDHEVQYRTYTLPSGKGVDGELVPSYGQWETWKTFSDQGTTTVFMLDPDTTYQFKVASVNQDKVRGFFTEPIVASTAPASGDGAPDAPSALVLSAPTDHAIHRL